MLQNRVWPDREAARAAPAGVLDMVACVDCAFAWNAAFDDGRQIYDSAYDNDQTQSERFREHADAVAKKVLCGLPRDRLVGLVEVGCGQGGFLSRLSNLGKGRFASLTGFDPAFREPYSDIGPGVKIHACYFGPQTVCKIDDLAEVVVSRHTIEHAPDPNAFLKAIRAGMREHAESRLFIETPDLSWILENLQLQDLFYEHCSLFTQRGLKVALERAGFESLAVEKVFGNQYLWAEARPALCERHPQISADGAELFRAELAQFKARSEIVVTSWRETVATRSQRESLWLWGASSKGVTFAILVDPDGSRLNGAIDINVNKTKKFMPLTALPIVSPDALCDGETVIVMNPNYREEIERSIKEMGRNARILALGEISRALDS